MNKHIKKLWIDALISGSYIQGIDRLCHKGQYNVFGVLCEITKIKRRDRGSFVIYGDVWISNPPSHLLERLHITENQTQHLLRMNYNNVSFFDMALWIDEHL